MDLITVYKILNSVSNFKMLTFISESTNYGYINKKIGSKIEKKNFSFLILYLDSNFFFKLKAFNLTY